MERPHSRSAPPGSPSGGGRWVRGIPNRCRGCACSTAAACGSGGGQKGVKEGVRRGSEGDLSIKSRRP
eukprot:711953-Prorocentrum_minimum.AAC.1